MKERTIKMAIEYSLMLEEMQLSNCGFFDEMRKVGIEIDKSKIETLEKGIQIYELYDTLGFSIALMDTSHFQFGFESEYLMDEFKNQQELSFRINKLFDRDQAIVNMLMIVFHVIDTVDTNCIFEFNGDTIRLARLNGIMYIKPGGGFWDNEKFKYFIEEREYRWLKPDVKI